MAVTYKWTINQMNAHIKDEGQDNVIFNLHWDYTGSEESGGKTYTSNILGCEQFTYKAGDAFVPYKRTEAMGHRSIGWRERAIEMDDNKTKRDENIQKQKKPDNEDGN